MESEIPGVWIEALNPHEDQRGWLVELFRADTLPEGFEPAMGYFSVTRAGIARGPHEHEEQTDGFLFFDGDFDLYLWENRQGLPDRREVLRVGSANKVFVLVPPGVVHAYKNVGERDAFVINIPNQLYGGWGRREPVDEIRHEDQESSRFQL